MEKSWPKATLTEVKTDDITQGKHSWTPLLKGLKDYCCLSKMSGGCRLRSRLTILRYLPTIKQPF